MNFFVTKIEFYDEFDNYIGHIKAFDEETFDVKVEGLVSSSDLREIVEMLSEMERSGGHINLKKVGKCLERDQC